jgi:hypothetical protein
MEERCVVLVRSTLLIRQRNDGVSVVLTGGSQAHVRMLGGHFSTMWLQQRLDLPLSARSP